VPGLDGVDRERGLEDLAIGNARHDAQICGGAQVLQALQRLEDLGAAAYLGVMSRIADREILQAALSIHSVEARHATTFNTILGKDITPTGAFAQPASMEEVLPVVQLFIAA